MAGTDTVKTTVRAVHAALVAELPAGIAARVSEPEAFSLGGDGFWISLGRYRARFEDLDAFGYIVEDDEDEEFLRGRSLPQPGADEEDGPFLDQDSPLEVVIPLVKAELFELLAREGAGTLTSYGINLA